MYFLIDHRAIADILKDLFDAFFAKKTKYFVGIWPFFYSTSEKGNTFFLKVPGQSYYSFIGHFAVREKKLKVLHLNNEAPSIYLKTGF